MKIIGITGSVAMGKSSAVKMLCYLRYPVFDADATVAQLYQFDQALIQEIVATFPEVLVDNEINKGFLAQKVFSDVQVRKRLERIIHPKVHQAAKLFTAQCQRLRSRVVFWDIPLLLQSDLQYQCDEIWVVSAPAFLQSRRVLRRKGWDQERFDKVRRLQVSQMIQEKMADRIIPTGIGKAQTMRCLKKYISECFT